MLQFWNKNLIKKRARIHKRDDVMTSISLRLRHGWKKKNDNSEKEN